VSSIETAAQMTDWGDLRDLRPAVARLVAQLSLAITADRDGEALTGGDEADDVIRGHGLWWHQPRSPIGLSLTLDHHADGGQVLDLSVVIQPEGGLEDGIDQARNAWAEIPPDGVEVLVEPGSPADASSPPGVRLWDAEVAAEWAPSWVWVSARGRAGRTREEALSDHNVALVHRLVDALALRSHLVIGAVRPLTKAVRDDLLTGFAGEYYARVALGGVYSPFWTSPWDLTLEGGAMHIEVKTTRAGRRGTLHLSPGEICHAARRLEEGESWALAGVRVPTGLPMALAKALEVQQQSGEPLKAAAAARLRAALQRPLSDAANAAVRAVLEDHHEMVVVGSPFSPPDELIQAVAGAGIGAGLTLELARVIA